MEKMKKGDLQLKFDSQKEEWYVIKVKDELMKNHKELENIVSGVMPKNKTDPLCPVDSFRKYLSHLNPENDYMWQTPLDKVNTEMSQIWYGRQHIGKNPLRTFMSDLSEKCKLSQIYTNHSIRVTGCTVLNRCNFSASEIISVSSHKSVQSLAIYQKTQYKQKVNMGNALFQLMAKPQEEIQLEGPPAKRALPGPEMLVQSEKALVPVVKDNIQGQILPFEPNFDDNDVSDMDLLSALCGLENSNVSVTNSTSVITNTMPRALFANCQIGTLNLTIYKK